MPESKTTERPSPGEFAEQAEGTSHGLIGEFISFLSHNKKWWLAPIVVVLLLLGLLVLIGGTAAAPFIYTLF
ncbi:MAG: DUF5989 family protein [Planctomycetota bacterium]|jgi:hypothetical protein